MKLFATCAILLALALGSEAILLGNGQPGCKSEQEIQDKYYGNFYDPTSYWVCSELNKDATLERCNDMTAFLPSQRKCVSWDDWAWEAPIAPLSNPGV